MKSSKKLRRATKGNNGHWSWKNQNGQEKAKTSNERHKKSKWKPGYIKTRKSNEEQQNATNGKWKRVPKIKTSNKKQQRAFLFPFSFIRNNSKPMEGGLYQEQ